MLNNYKKFLLLSIIFTKVIFSQSNISVENIFIGQFSTFDPYALSYNRLNEIAPNFNTNQIFLWINQESTLDFENYKLEVEYTDKNYSEFDVKIFRMNSLTKKNKLSIKKNDRVYFYYQGNKYESTINEFYYYSGWTKGIFCSIDIPKSLIRYPENHIFEFFPILASTNSEIKLLFNQFTTGQNDQKTYRYMDYQVKSEIKGTRTYSHYGSEIKEFSLIVYYKNKKVYNFKSNTKVYYMFGKFEKHSSMFLYLFEISEGRNYKIVLFSFDKYLTKNYFQESVD